MRRPSTWLCPLFRHVSIIAAFCASGIGLTLPIHAQVRASEHRLWVLDLGAVPSYRQLKQQGEEVAQASSVVFVDANTIAVTYRIADPTGSQATDAVSFFDANSGSFRSSLRWPTPERSSADRNFIRVLPTRNGEFLVVVGYTIRHYSAAQKELQLWNLTNGSAKGGEWVVTVCPDGKMALAKRFGPGSHEDHWISTETLEEHAIASAPFYGYGYGVGQGFVVYNPAFADDPQTQQIHIHSYTGQDRVLCIARVRTSASQTAAYSSAGYPRERVCPIANYWVAYASSG
jgi:hypothetical protein